MALINRITSAARPACGIFNLVKSSTSALVPKRDSNSQHRVILLPEVPPDTEATNPLLKKYDLNGVLDLSSVNQSQAYNALGKLLLEYEAEVGRIEEKCIDGVTDFKALFTNLEVLKCQFENIWSTVNMMGITTDILDQDRFSLLHRRAERAFLTRINSRHIYGTLQKIMHDLNEKNEALSEEGRIVSRLLLESRHQGFDLSNEKFDELNSNWMRQLNDQKGVYNYRMMICNGRFRHVITNPNIVQDFPVDVLRVMGSDSSQPSKGPWTLTLHPYIFKQFMAYCPERKLRFNAHIAKVMQGSKLQDNNFAVVSYVKDIRKLRFDQAITLGYKSFADMSMETKMATNVDNVKIMISSLLGKAKQKQEVELETLQAYAESRGFDEQLEVYDVGFFKRKQRRTILGVSDEDLRNFFPFPKVLSGIFLLCQKLFGIRFEELHQEAYKSLVWHKDVSLFRILDEKTDKVLGHFYLDPFIRDDKGYAGNSKGWFIPLRQKSTIAGCLPLGALVLSFPQPNYGKPSLLNFFETEELLRNFGSLLIHVLSNNNWSDLSGKTGMEWDVLDLPGKFMSHWLYHPDVLNLLSGHWSTSEPLSSEIVDKLCNVAIKQHLAGYHLCEELFKAAYDIAFYSEDYEKESIRDLALRLHPNYLLLPKVSQDEFPLHCKEMIGGEQAASVFCSTWSSMLAADCFSAVQEVASKNGKIFDQEGVVQVTNRFRNTFLKTSSALPAAEVFRRFRGRDPSHEALLLSLGLKSPQSPKKKGQSDENALS